MPHRLTKNAGKLYLLHPPFHDLKMDSADGKAVMKWTCRGFRLCFKNNNPRAWQGSLPHDNNKTVK